MKLKLSPTTLHYVGDSCWPYFKSIAFTNLKLQIVKVGKLDVCGRPLFANLVANVIYYDQSHCNGFYTATVPLTRQLCEGRCGGSFEVNVTQFGSIIIPCGDVLPSNNRRVNYCNETSSSPLALGTDVLYNLTDAQIHQNGNILYCAVNMQSRITCYKLNVFCKLPLELSSNCI